MKRIILITAITILSILSICNNTYAAQFINPLFFKTTQKEQVIEFIKTNMHKQYCENSMLNMCSATTLRMMEQQELKSFKQLIKISNPNILKNVIKTYCENSMLDMCTYNILLMMYNQEVKATNESLDW